MSEKEIVSFSNIKARHLMCLRAEPDKLTFFVWSRGKEFFDAKCDLANNSWDTKEIKGLRSEDLDSIACCPVFAIDEVGTTFRPIAFIKDGGDKWLVLEPLPEPKKAISAAERLEH